MRIAFFTLGCKVNQFETGAMERLLAARGHEIVPWEEPADAYVVNTCTVTATSDKKSRQTIRGVRRSHPEAVVAVCGCMGQGDPQAAAALGVDLVAGADDRHGFVTLLEATASDRGATVAVTRAETHKEYESLPAGELSGRTRALLKVQDGCENFCTYCIIPHVRGPARSMPLEDARREAARLAAEGYREAVVTGIEISSYGKDLPDGVGLAGLVETVCRAAPGVRIRLGSLEPRTVTEDFAARLSALPNLCPHFHLSLQSGCDATLRRMGRRYDTAQFAQSLAGLRAAWPDCAVTTDLIVGFPGETEDEFLQTLAFVAQCAFAGMHIFPYSRRAGTPAALLPGQVTRAVKKDRAARMAELSGRMTQSYLRGCRGKTLRVLFEEQTQGLAKGHAENYMQVAVTAADGLSLPGEVRDVQIADVRDGLLWGETHA